MVTFFSGVEMKAKTLTFFLAMLCSLALVKPVSSEAIYTDETVETVDGRTIVLRSDGTYEWAERAGNDSLNYLEETGQLFEKHVGQRGRESIRFVPMFRNVSESEIVGIRFRTTFQDSFGSEVFSFDGDLSERLRPGARSTDDLFYVFENNRYIANQPYNKLLPMLTGGTGRAVTRVTAIAFEDGQVIQFD